MLANFATGIFRNFELYNNNNVEFALKLKGSLQQSTIINSAY